jgi:transcriptional regulator with GAF, ATPase, and Fis domain
MKKMSEIHNSPVSTMKNYTINLNIIIPFIFSGIAILSFIIAFNISKYPNFRPFWYLATWGIAIAAVSFLCGFLVFWTVISPVRNFMKRTEEMGILDQFMGDKTSKGDRDEIDHFSGVFDGVVSFLSKVDAKAFFPEIIGQSRVVRGLLDQILKVAATDTTIMIMGESGTGKELVATSIYNNSLRRNNPFVELSCVAIPEGLLESELFGHEKGSFTGATGRKLGKFEIADKGTIFLDEIGDMSLATQAKLLRVLQEQEFERVGGTTKIKVNVRFIAATNKNIPKMVKEGSFREDLYYRLNVFSLVLPPLRERREDIPLLIDYFLQAVPNEVKVSPEAFQYLISYSWPGNVRELKNTIERAALVSDDAVIRAANLPAVVLSSAAADTPAVTSLSSVSYDIEESQDISIDSRLREIEKKMITEALIRVSGVQKRAADLLGIKERSLWHRIKKYNIDVGLLKKQD